MNARTTQNALNQTVARAPYSLPTQPTIGDTMGVSPMTTATQRAMTRPLSSGETLICTMAFAVVMTWTPASPIGIWSKAKMRNDGACAERAMANANTPSPVSYTHLRAHETPEHLVCRL